MRLLFIFLALLVFFAGWTMASDKIVFVGATGASDTAVETRLKALGFDVEEHNQTEKQPVSITGAVAVFIFESVSSSNITSAYKDAAIPVITTEAYILDDMKFAPDATFDTTAGQFITIVDPNHPIAGGLKGDLQVAPSAVEMCSCSGLKVDGHVIANAKTPGFPCLVIFEKGMADMDGKAIPARRAFAFVHANLAPVMTNEGWQLLERTVLWALEKLNETSVNPVQKLSLTWGDVKAVK